jgi:putative Ca2+/H+ antiporter (TMEM165/GDT1 family)
VLKIGDKTQLGAVLLASSLVADIQLIAAVTVWTLGIYIEKTVDVEILSAVISLSGGALLANIVSVVLYIGETLKSKR